MDTRTNGSRPGAIALVALLLALVALALPAVALAADVPWTAQRSGTTQPLYGVSFVSATTGWAVGGGGTILRTTNGGTTWKAQSSRTAQALYAVRFIDASKGWAVGARGTIVRTTDGGATWAAQPSGTSQSLNAVTFAGTTDGYAAGGRSTILRTSDGGATWKVVTSNGKDTYSGVACADAATVWVVGSKGVVRKSTDGGATWISQSSGTHSTLNSIVCTNPALLWIAGSGGTVRSTANGGATWTAKNAGTSQTLNSVSFDAAGHLRVAGSSGVVRVSANGGGVWAGEATGTTQSLYAAAWSGSHGWIVGGGGTILSYQPDTAPPSTTASGLQGDDHSGWTNATVTVSLSATDTGNAGVAATYYTVDGGLQKTYTGPFPVSGQGRHVVTYWSVDAVGNTEAVKTGYVNIDTTPPTVASDADAAWHTTDVTVTLSAADTGGSGVAATQYRVSGGDWTTAAGNQFVVPATSTQGPHTYDIRSLDAAGNSSSVGSCTVKIDATAPVTTPTGLGADELSDWSATARTVTLSADDGEGSGVKTIHYTVDGGAAQTYTKAFTVSGAGQHPVTYWAEDTIGNIEAVHTGWVNISDPFAQSENLAADMDSHWHNGAVTVTITGHGQPGPLTIHYSIDDVAQPDAGSPCSFPVAGVGHHKVVFWATNGNGQESLHQTGYVNIDMTAPTTTTQVSAPKGWVNHGVTLVFLSSDDHAGVVSTFSTLDGGKAVEGTSRELAAPADHSFDGIHTVGYWSVDAAGNVEAANQAIVRIDTRQPRTRAPYAAAVLRWRTVKLRFVVNDDAPCAGTAAAKVVVKNARGRVVKTLKVAKVRTGVTSSKQFRCKLARGKYKFFVYAVDAAGNAQSKIASNRLTVR